MTNKICRYFLFACPKLLVVVVILLFGVITKTTAQQKIATNTALSPRQESIVRIAAFTATGDQSFLKDALNEGLDKGLTVNEIKEVLVQLYAYVGFPRSLNAINTFETVLKERKEKGIKEVIGREPGKQDFKNGKFAYGKEVQTKLTGSTTTGAAQKFVPVIDTFLKEHLFADIFSRDNLDYQSREIATISALASLEGTEAQLRSHLNVGKNVGLTEEQLRGVASTLSTEVGYSEGLLASRLLDNMYGRSGASHPETPRPDMFSKGNKVTNNNFTGEVWVNMLIQNDTTFNTTIGSVTFAPGARSNWHYHPSGQILLVTEGLGYYQEKGKEIQVIRKGDVVKCPPSISHWHGGSKNQSMMHMAISPKIKKGNVVWLDKVSDEEYFAGVKQ